MKPELAEKLCHMQANPTTGTPHNQQVVSTQVETVFALDLLAQEVVKLRKTIEKSNEQSGKLENSNYRLQVVMLILTALSTGVVLLPFFQGFVNSITPNITNLLNQLGAVHATDFIVTVIPALISIIVAFSTFVAEKKVIKRLNVDLQESIKMRDHMSAVLMDSKGRVKETRES